MTCDDPSRCARVPGPDEPGGYARPWRSFPATCLRNRSCVVNCCFFDFVVERSGRRCEPRGALWIFRISTGIFFSKLCPANREQRSGDFVLYRYLGFRIQGYSVRRAQEASKPVGLTVPYTNYLNGKNMGEKTPKGMKKTKYFLIHTQYTRQWERVGSVRRVEQRAWLVSFVTGTEDRHLSGRYEPHRTTTSPRRVRCAEL